MITYFSGPHGAGKSSLIRQICTDKSFVQYPDRLKFAHVEDPALRQKAKATKFFQEYCDQLNFQQEHTGREVLADRCIYDMIAYDTAFKRLGWITPRDEAKNDALVQALFPSLLRPERVVIVNPPLECLVSHLRKRWEAEQKKWREDNFEYLKAVHDAYKNLPEFYCIDRLLLIEENLPIEEEAEIFFGWHSRTEKESRQREPAEQLVY